MLVSQKFTANFRIAAQLFSIVAMLGFATACQPSSEDRKVAAKRYLDTGQNQAAVIELKNALREDPNDAEARSLIARASFQLADFPAALDEYERSLALGADSTDNWIGVAQSMLRLGRAAEALDRVSPNLDRDSADDLELSVHGDIFAALGNYAEAREFYSRAIAVNQQSERGLIGLAVVAAGNADFQEAQRLLGKATLVDGASPRAWQILGNFRRIRGDLQGAAEAYQTAMDRETSISNLADLFDTRTALASTAIDIKDLVLAQSMVTELSGLFGSHPMLHFLNGRIAFVAGDLNLASTELQEYLSNSPRDLRAHAVMGAINFSQNYYSQAEMYLQQAVRGEVGGEAALRLLAETRLRLNRPEETLDLLKGAGFDNSSDASLLGLLGRAEFNAGNRDRGLEYFEKGFAADPTKPSVGLMYAMALIWDGQNEKAIELLNEMPDHEDAKHRREMLIIAALERNDSRAKALLAADEFLEINIVDATAHALIGAFKFGIGLPRPASTHFQYALKLDGRNEIALFGIASLARSRGDLIAAEYSLNELLDVHPDYMPGLEMLAGVLLPSGRRDDFARRVEAAVEASPRASAPRLVQAKLALLSGNSERAFKLIREMREMFPDLSALHHLEGVALIRLGQMESALISLTRAANAKPDNARFQFDLAVARLQSEDYYGANESIERYRVLRPVDPIGLSLQVSALIGLREYGTARSEIDDFATDGSSSGIISVLRGDVDLADNLALQAAGHFETASETLWDRGIALRLSSAYLAAGSPKAPQPLAKWLDKNPDDAPVRRSYGELLQSSGAQAEAIAAYEKVIETDPNDAIALNNLAWEYALRGNPESVAMAMRAYELQPEESSIVDTYGWILHLNGRSDEAEPILRKAANISPQNGNIQYHLAKVLADTGRRDEARKTITPLIESNSSFSSRADALELAKTL